MICNVLEECINCKCNQDKQPICPNKGNCNCIKSGDNRSQIKCEEKGKKYILENTSMALVVSYKMDGGVIVEDRMVPKGTNKCDYLYIVQGADRDAILIELKGTDIATALKQVKGTLNLFQNVLRKCKHVYGRIVVASSLPNLKARPEYVNLVKLLASTYHGNLKIGERRFLEKDIELHIKQS